MDAKLANELSDCIAELYEGLDELRAEVEALKVTLKARSGRGIPRRGPGGVERPVSDGRAI